MSQPLPLVLHALFRCRALAGGLAVLAGWLAAGVVAAADYESLSQVESAAETREYTRAVGDRKFEPAQRDYLRGILLPQLAKDANRASIARTRQRIRDLAVRDATNELFDPINVALRDDLLEQAAAAGADPLIRVNSMLMLGELVGADGKPWPPAAKPLAEAVADAGLPAAVRVAALAGLARHLAAVGGGSAEIAAVARPAVTAVLTQPFDGDPVAHKWLQARALDLLPAVAPSPAAIAVAAGILADDAADPDQRVRAAAALGRVARPDAGVDAAAAVNQIRALAAASLEADLARAERRRVVRNLVGGDGQRPDDARRDTGRGLTPAGGLEAGGGTEFKPDEDAVSPLACRRAAWRLFTLAEALRPGRSGPGLAELLPAAAAAAAGDLASSLRQAALDLDAQPDEPTLKRALAMLEEVGQPPASPAAGEAPPSPAKPPAGPGPEPSDPFGKPADPSPF